MVHAHAHKVHILFIIVGFYINIDLNAIKKLTAIITNIILPASRIF